MSVRFTYDSLSEYDIEKMQKFSMDDCIRAMEVLRQRMEVFSDRSYLAIEVRMLPLSTRAMNVLLSQRLVTVRDVLLYGMENVAKQRNAGVVTCKEISRVIDKIVENKNTVETMSAEELWEFLSC